MNYQEKVAAEVRIEREKELAKIRKGMIQFRNAATWESRTLYCYEGIRSAPFTVTDGTYGLCIDCQTIESARDAFRSVMNKWISCGFERVA